MKKAYLLCLLTMFFFTACGKNEENTSVKENIEKSSSLLVSTTVNSGDTVTITTTESEYEELHFTPELETHKFESLEDMMNYIEKVKPDNDYILPTTHNDKYTFKKGVYNDGNGVYYIIYSVDDIGTTLICSSVDAYIQNPEEHKAKAIEEEKKNNGWLICDLTDYEKMTGFYQATSDRPDNYIFIGLNDGGYEYSFDFIKNDDSDSTKEELLEIYNDFEFNTYE